MKSTDIQDSIANNVSPGDDEAKQPWEPMRLTYAGEAKDIVRGGVGKQSITQADMGDTNKPQGQT